MAEESLIYARVKSQKKVVAEMSLTCQLLFEKWYYTYFSDKWLKRFDYIGISD